MREPRSVEEHYDVCVTHGEINLNVGLTVSQIKGYITMPSEMFILAKEAVVKKTWTSAFKLHYEVLSRFSQVFLFFENVGVLSDKCLFTYLCVRHPELELNWDFFEKVCTKYALIREGAVQVTQKDWQEVSLPFSLYIGLLKEKIEEKLSQ